MKWLLIPVGILVCCILLIFIIGIFLPVKHTASLRIYLRAADSNVWRRIVDISEYPAWRRELQSVQVLTGTSWVEVDKRGHKISYSMEVGESGRKLTTKINGSDLPFGGSWTYVLERDGQGSALTITENGEVYNPLFRFMSKFIFGHSTTLKKYAADLERSFSGT